MRKQKTANKNRSSYVYYTADGKKHVITTEEVEQKWIGLGHEMDDEEFNANRRENYHAPVHFDAFCDEEEGDMADINSYLADEDADPLNLLIDMYEEEKHREELEKLRCALVDLTPEQRDLINKRFSQEKSITEIALEEGVSRAAIRKRLNTIYAIIKKNF